MQNVYEYERNTQTVFSGEVSVKGKHGDIAGLPPITVYDRHWTPITIPEVVALSAKNPTVLYFLPDGCGNQARFVGGDLVDGYAGIAPTGPIMTRSPR